MPDGVTRVAWITLADPERTPDGDLQSSLASLRYRVLAPLATQAGSPSIGRDAAKTPVGVR